MTRTTIRSGLEACNQERRVTGKLNQAVRFALLGEQAPDCMVGRLSMYFATERCLFQHCAVFVH